MVIVVIILLSVIKAPTMGGGETPATDNDDGAATEAVGQDAQDSASDQESTDPRNSDIPDWRIPEGTLFGTGAGDAFENDSFRGGSGQWATGMWRTSPNGGRKEPDLRVDDRIAARPELGRVYPHEGRYMGRIRHQGFIMREVSLIDSRFPVMRFDWATAMLLQEGDTGQLLVNDDVLATLDHTSPMLEWMEVEVDLSPYAGQVVSIKFQVQGREQQAAIYLDDIRITER